MTATIAKRARSVQSDLPQGLPALRVVPILGKSARKPAYRLLEGQALAGVQVKEISAGGSVPELMVENTLDELVYLMDGQELIGAKQNRILNTDVLIAGKATIRIPVSCVEAHRWRYTTGLFSPGKSASHMIRANKQRRVHESLRGDRGHDADQGAVWQEVGESMRASKTSSNTAALHEAYQQREPELDAFRQSLHIPDQAVGLAVFRGRQFLGLDLFDRHSTLVCFWKNLLDSYAIDWLFAGESEAGQDAEQDTRIVQSHLERAASGKWERFASPGEGADHRLADAELTGSALVWNDKAVVHMQLFPVAG